MSKNGVLIFFGLLLLAGAIVTRGDSGRYSFAYSGRLTYAKLDTHTGDGWLCGAEIDACIPMTNKPAFLAYADRAKAIEQLKSAGFTDEEIKQWIEKDKSQK